MKTKVPSSSVNLFSRKIPFYFLLITVLVLCLGFYFFGFLNQTKKPKKITEKTEPINYVSQRLIVDDEYELIEPLAFIDFSLEDSLLSNIKASIEQYIAKKKQDGTITAASAYLRNLNRHLEARISPSEIYFPGSLMKLPILISILKESESHPEFLEKSILFDQAYDNLPLQNIQIGSIILGHSYKVKELLNYMIVYSDNNATALLSQNIGYDKIVKVFKHLKLPIPSKTQTEYALTLKDYSCFYRILFNSTYLGWNKSEYALELLTKAKYSDGLLKYLDHNVKVAHKFGERNSDGVQQMHEVGIVYLAKNPYLIGVMTKGHDLKQLENVVADISKIAYDGMKNSAKK